MDFQEEDEDEDANDNAVDGLDISDVDKSENGEGVSGIFGNKDGSGKSSGRNDSSDENYHVVGLSINPCDFQSLQQRQNAFFDKLVE